MKISLQILEDWLKDFSPESVCRSKEIRLSEIRIYQDGDIMQPFILYLGYANQFFGSSDSRVICKNREDYLVLQTENISVVLNKVLDAFSYYARWEEEIDRRILAGCPLSEILDSAEVLLRIPMQVVDGAQVRIGRSYGFATYKKDDDWKRIMDEPTYPAEVLSLFNQKYLHTFEKKEVFFLPDDFFPTTAWCRHVFLDNERFATLIVPADGHTFSTGELHLIELITGQIKKWIVANNQSDETAKNISYFAKLLDGAPESEKEFEKHLSEIGWKTDSPKQIFVASVISQNFYMEALLSRILFEHSAGIYAIPYQKQIVILYNSDYIKPADFTAQLHEFLFQNHYYAASSLPFLSLSQAVEAYQQAYLTLRRSPPSVGMIYSVTEGAMRYISSIVEKNSVINLIHPVLKEISSYDKKHRTEYYDTLFCFLKNERNHQITAQELYIHRNTLFKRIRKIEELWPLKYDDAELRYYLLFSFFQNLYCEPDYH